jgi:hypothetical protein
MYTGE